MFTQDSDATTELRSLYIVVRGGDLGRSLDVECISSLVSCYTEADGLFICVTQLFPHPVVAAAQLFMIGAPRKRRCCSLIYREEA